MKNYKLTISYDGSRYRGWQRLKDNSATIQEKIETCLSKMCGTKIEIIGSGRTDGGAHAEAQVANFHTKGSFSPKEILLYCYQYLPEDIVITKVEEVHERFHARYNAKSKLYRYRVCNSLIHNVFQRKYALHEPLPLNLSAMKKGAKLLIGEHDFKSFTSDKVADKKTIRTITKLDIEVNDIFIDFLIEADGFLYNMVRIIVGTLLEIGKNEREIESITTALNAGVRLATGQKISPNGLTLVQVNYE